MNKKLLIIGTIIASIGLTGCADKTPGEEDIMPVEDVDVDNDDNDADTGDAEGLKAEDKEGKTEMNDEEMIDESDYIAKVKMIEKGQGNLELKVLDNIKGDITADKVPNVESLEKHRTYLVFLKNEDGKVEVTNGDDSLILLEGDNHEIFEKINKKHRNNEMDIEIE